ncbi:MAG: hypothetical protein P4M12_05760, partial [Gammaproteobacteria bacterium]|nr:hypothetical protein [Gammaproteobacteria bacterium]
DASLLNINAAGVVSLKTGVTNNLAKSSYSFNVVATDNAGTNVATQAVAVTITDVIPTITSATIVTVPEGTDISATVYTATASDVAGTTIRYGLTGTDASLLTIDELTGVVRFISIPNAQLKNVYNFNITSSDSILTSTQAVTVNISDVAPNITSGITVTVPESTTTATTVYTAAASDIAGTTLTYGMTGTDAALFTIDASTGVVKFIDAPNAQLKSVYNFNVTSSDGILTSTQAVTVNIGDVAPVVTSPNSVAVPKAVPEAAPVTNTNNTATTDATIQAAALVLPAVSVSGQNVQTFFNSSNVHAQFESPYADSSYAQTARSSANSAEYVNKNPIKTLLASSDHIPSWGWENTPGFIELTPIVRGLSATISTLQENQMSRVSELQSLTYRVGETNNSSSYQQQAFNVISKVNIKDETKIALNTDAKSEYIEKQNIKLAKNQTFKDRVKKLLDDFGLGDDDV